MTSIRLICADTLDVLPGIPSQSVDAVITDPPYPCIKRDYGTWTVEEWWALMVEGVIPQVRRILKPSGSAVFILQPNSEHVGQMRGWLWEFMAWVCREWNMIQDAYWWNTTAQPCVHTHRDKGLMRPSIKPCVWMGEPDCYRSQDAILWGAADWIKTQKTTERALEHMPSGYTIRRGRVAETSIERGGVTPFNVIPIPVKSNGAGAHGHGAGTPLKLADWWTRYICPPGGTVLDPFVGSGTMMLAAIQNGCNGIGIDKEQRYIDIAQRRVDEQLDTPMQVSFSPELVGT